ncbi:hypothetical protein [Streptomyces griseocarneus]|uniref:hypothetical protein n=1 Tax=Streptomyces griseocarneus TaxID=51201 RepID=UPI00167E8DFD|nr:hypothetical protein [Streptomyces griseocarneus]MBZ6475851.1 hypothetical protein [Streptomyces griseocarneus]GHG50400.1 hypothetical protein GCM10018779_10480 [Streptomyces griseocarneus]
MTAQPGIQPQSRWSAYEWWQSRLAREFFSKDRKDAPVLFFIDKAELLTLQGQDEVEELGTAVSSVLAWHGNPYRPVADRCHIWGRGKREDPPPCLPLLAAAVLAAASMRRTTAGPGASAYYARLAEVLRPSWGGGQHQKPLQVHYGAIVEQWECLDEWLREQGGARGISTVRKDPTYTKIGYAQSQALVRASDHTALNRFFQAARLSPGQRADGAQLLRDLKLWSFRYPQGLSKGLRQALGSDADRSLLEPLLVALLEGWDGTVAYGRADGLLQVPLRVVLEEDSFAGWEVGWHAEAVPEVESDSLKHPGGTLELMPEAGGQVYALSGAIPSPASALRLGFTAYGAKTAVRIESGRDVLALREDPVAGGWTETDVLTVFEPYVFLFTPHGQSQLHKLLADTGQQWYRPEPVPMPGWQATPELQFSDEAALTAALARSGVQDVRCVPGRRLSLRNGLRVKPEWRQRSLFLLGGEPDVMVPQEFREPGLVMLDGQPLAVPAEGLVALRGKGLATGQHVLSADGSEITFYLEQGAEPQAGAPAAPVSGTPADTVAVPLGGDARFLTAQGRFLTIPRPQEPAWWKGRASGLCGGGTARVPVPPEAVWLVIISASGEPSVILLRPEEPDIGSLSLAAKDFWSKIILFSPTGVPYATLWRRYREAALSQFPQGGFGRV